MGLVLTWLLAKLRLKDIVERAGKLGATATVLHIDWNSLLKPPGDGQGKVSATRPGARVIIPLTKDRITAVRKSVEESNKAGLGAERLRAPGSPSC